MWQRPFFLLVVVVFAAALAGVDARPNEIQSPSVMCKLPEARGLCRAVLLRWRYDPATGKCHEFNFGGCAGNGNNFMTQKACMSVCAGI